MCDKQHYDDLVNKVQQLSTVVKERHLADDISIRRFADKLGSMESTIESNAESNSDVIHLLRDLKGFFRVVKWFAATVTLFAGAWYAITHVKW